MNFHDDNWIFRNVRDHLDEASRLIEPKNIVGIFLQGSQNYGLDYEESDVDTKCIITPSFKDIALAKEPKSTTHVRSNDEHIDLKDIRLYIKTFRKQNLNFLEILFTKYFFLTGLYKYQWNRLVYHREDIAHFDRVKNVKAMQGVASEKYFAMEHHYPSRMYWIDKFGYDPKQLHHLLRIEEYLKRYISGEAYEDCMIPKDADFLKEVKKGYYNLEQAKEIATKSYVNIHNIADEFIENHKNEEPNKEIDELLDDVAYRIMEISIRRDFEL